MANLWLSSADILLALNDEDEEQNPHAVSHLAPFFTARGLHGTRESNLEGRNGDYGFVNRCVLR